MSSTTVHRYMSMFGLQPHRSRSFKLSNDPFFIEKVRDIVGLYLNPPEHALVLCVDAKSQVQALERTQPLLPMGLGYVEGVTHDYIRPGTTTNIPSPSVGPPPLIRSFKNSRELAKLFQEQHTSARLRSWQSSTASQTFNARHTRLGTFAVGRSGVSWIPSAFGKQSFG